MRWLCRVMLVVGMAMCATGCRQHAAIHDSLDTDTYNLLRSLDSDGDRQTVTMRLQNGYASPGQLRAIAKYYQDFPGSNGMLRLSMLAALGDGMYADPKFIEWILNKEGLTEDRSLRGYAWYYLWKINHRVTEADLKHGFALAYSHPGYDVDGTVMSPDKDCLGMMRTLAENHYPDADWWPEEQKRLREHGALYYPYPERDE